MLENEEAQSGKSPSPGDTGPFIGSGRALLTMAAVVSLAFAVAINWGFYCRIALGGALLALVLALVACALPQREQANSCKSSLWPAWAMASLLGLMAIAYNQVFFSSVEVAVFVLRLASLASALTTVSLIVHLIWSKRKRTILLWTQVAVLIVVGVVLRSAAVLASPRPLVDVFEALRGAPDHLLHGRNPYGAAYQSPYDFEPAAYDVYPFYPPLPFLVCLPFRALGLDVRLANALCDLSAALVLLAFGCHRGQPVLAVLVMASYLNMPRSPFMIEMAWYEPMLALALGGGFLLVDRGKRVGYLLLGIGLTGKQYGVVLLPPLWKAQRRHWFSLLIGVGVAGLAILGPFMLWDAEAFFNVVVRQQMARPIRMDAITLHVGIHDIWDVTIPPTVFWVPAIVLVSWVTWRTPSSTAAAGLWIGTAFLAFCLCHKQGFFNYFYLCEYLFLLGLAGLAGEPIVDRERRLLASESASPARCKN